ncbi:hypothetical protein [Methylobacterium symbioticum]|jgi:hypothetical protein|uniref:PilZ domain-containing protein n=1 Tax=Methylobacterium symbioticum TaxID=2584084 RepID=A0A509EEM0_9HYPH|nr:hypothetical protein [Methylobacterium symbioticum]VUD71683.1 hypothetical protein MET9862_02269 [Methylobacterium symbioticum]
MSDLDTQKHTFVTIPAAVIMPGGAIAACVVRDITPKGTRMSIARRHKLPSTFLLRMPKYAKPFPMRLVWQEGDFAGATLDLPAAKEKAAGAEAANAPPISPSTPGRRPSGAGR